MKFSVVQVLTRDEWVNSGSEEMILQTRRVVGVVSVLVSEVLE